MSVQPARTVGTASLVLLYLGIFLAGLVLLFAVIFAIEYFFNTEFANSSMGAVLLIVAGVTLGQRWYTIERQRPSMGRAWLVALLCGLATIVIQVGIFYATLGVAGPASDPILREISRQTPSTLAMFLAGLALFNTLVIRLGVWLGIRNQVKIEERQVAKGQ